MTAMALSETTAPKRSLPAGRTDPRLVGWRILLTHRCVDVLRGYQESWAEPGLDDAGRAAAAVGVVDGWPTMTMPKLPTDGELARVVERLGLGLADEAVLAAAWWAAVDPQVAGLFGCVHDDVSRRHATLGLLGLVLAADGVPMPYSLGDHHALVTSGLVDPVADAATHLQLPGTTVAVISGDQRPVPSAGALPDRLAWAVDQARHLLQAGQRVLVRCVVADDRALLRDAVAEALGMATAPAPRAAAVAALLFRLDHELPVVVLDDQEPLPDETVLALGGPSSTAPPQWHTLDVAAPSLVVAVRAWRTSLRKAGLRPAPSELADLAGRLQLAEASIRDIVGAARVAATVADRATDLDDVKTALRAHPRHDPGGLARRLPTVATLEDLVLPAPTRSALDDFIAHARWSAVATERLGFTGVRGRGVIALFHGPAGTGKTAAAEAAATALDRELWVVDLAKVVSKWLGETQRHLDSLLADAAAAGALLLFDEADGLFGKRGEVTDARDRYANLEIDHLLQRIELHDGIVVLTSNRPGALDQAFARRIRLSVRFDLPDHDEREEIWERYLPDKLLDRGVTPSRGGARGALGRRDPRRRPVRDGQRAGGRHQGAPAGPGARRGS